MENSSNTKGKMKKKIVQLHVIENWAKIHSTGAFPHISMIWEIAYDPPNADAQPALLAFNDVPAPFCDGILSWHKTVRCDARRNQPPLFASRTIIGQAPGTLYLWSALTYTTNVWNALESREQCVCVCVFATVVYAQMHIALCSQQKGIIIWTCVRTHTPSIWKTLSPCPCCTWESWENEGRLYFHFVIMI